MIAVIKDGKSYATVAHAPVLDYDIKESIYDTISTIAVPLGDITAAKEGDIVYVQGLFLGLISAIDIDEQLAILNCLQIVSLFAREMFYTSAAYTYLEDRLAQLISDNYTNCPDSQYAIPWLSVSSAGSTARTIEPDRENGIFSVKSYAAKLRRLAGIYLVWGVTTSALTCTVRSIAKPVKNIDFSNPAYKVTENAFSSAGVAKVTIYVKNTGTYQTWYRLADGTITKTPGSAVRASGEWVPVVIDEAADAENVAQETLQAGEYSHKITFEVADKKAFALYDPLRVRINGGIYMTYVSGVERRKGGATVTVSCGELQTMYPYLNM